MMMEAELFLPNMDTLKDASWEKSCAVNDSTSGMDRLLYSGHHSNDYTMAQRRQTSLVTASLKTAQRMSF
jgi:hypothetical protein